MKVLFFASIAEITGESELVVQDIKTLEELKQFLNKKFPAIAGLNFSMAVNKKIVQGNLSIVETDEVALLPPFSGG